MEAVAGGVEDVDVGGDEVVESGGDGDGGVSVCCVRASSDAVDTIAAVLTVLHADDDDVDIDCRGAEGD